MISTVGAGREVRVRFARLVAAVSVALPLSACGITHVRDLSFTVDHRLHFLSPKDRAKVRNPVTISWRIHGFRLAASGSEPPSRDAGYFAVFVDRQPIRPNQTMRAVAGGDRSCEHDPKCPDAAYLANHGVYTTTGTSIRLDQVPNLNSRDRIQLHSFVVVLMDTAGHRIGESAWELDLRIPRAGL
jgi:hypothetical protein